MVVPSIASSGTTHAVVVPSSPSFRALSMVVPSPHLAGHPCHLPLQSLQPTVATSFPQPPPLSPAAHDHCSNCTQPLIPCSNDRSHNKVLANRSHYPSSTLAATSRCHLLPSSSITAIAASSSSLPLPSARPQQHTASIDVVASPIAFPAFCPLFHAVVSLGRIIILPKGGPPLATSVPPLLICRRPAFDGALPLLPLPPTSRRDPSPACCRSAPVPLSQLPLPSLFLPFLPYRCLLAATAATSLRPLLSVVPSFPCISTTVAANCQIQRCPTSSPQPQSLPATIAAPLQSPPLLAASPLLSALTAATCRKSPLPPVAASSFAAAALAATTISNRALATASPCCHRYNSLLPATVFCSLSNPLNYHLHLIHSLNNSHPTFFTDN
ncbi:hypothetical protein BHE74_00012627 [Ensete ventricosum]|uniref:Uncharacterized protein n=1 Tax=Ensete ventricosum TaxID=4639 RepID=A0A445MBV2_ENSVE|nr:hypothetical protein BHE74_00012627 [Ensete ventricosum]RZR71713.1 hypothetical protein BHM03_00006751 [Ensete ventricosum]